MIAFRLDDFKDQPLREAGAQLGIPNAATLSKDELIREIKSKVSPSATGDYGNDSLRTKW
jgi:hypothetical protein